MKKTFAILMVLMMVFTLAACGDKPSGDRVSIPPPYGSGQSEGTGGDEGSNKGSKTFDFPQWNFIPGWAVYAGSGTYVFTNNGSQEDEKILAYTCLDGTRLEDVQDYIQTLKGNGLVAAANMEEEELQDGKDTMNWYGVTADKSFGILVVFSTFDEEIEDPFYNTGIHNYNLLIQVTNYDYYEEYADEDYDEDYDDEYYDDEDYDDMAA